MKAVIATFFIPFLIGMVIGGVLTQFEVLRHNTFLFFAADIPIVILVMIAYQPISRYLLNN